MGPRMMKEYADLRTEQIVGAAWECFCENGYGKTTMRDIAKRMNATTGVIYNYFKSKREILEALLTSSISQNEHLFDEISKEHQGFEAVKTAFSSAFESVPLAIQQRNSRGNIGLWMEAVRDEKIRKLLDTFYTDFQGYFRKFLKQAVVKGEVDPGCDVKSMASLYLALFIGLQVQQVVLDGAATKAYARNVTATLFEHVTAGGGKAVSPK